MAELHRSDWRSYDLALSQQQAAASDLVSRSIRAYAAASQGLTVADMREYATRLLSQSLRAYGAAGSAVAAAQYDRTMEQIGAGVPLAEPFDDLDEDEVERIVRYQAGKLASGDLEGFASALASAASDHVLLCANRTGMENAGRDRGAGVRFARVLTGRENCTFCTMLASRGFVYRTRATAGAFDRWHRNCDCRVIAGVDGIEGYDLDALRDRWRAFEEIDARADDDGTPWPKKRKDAAKAAYAAEHPVWS